MQQQQQITSFSFIVYSSIHVWFHQWVEKSANRGGGGRKSNRIYKCLYLKKKEEKRNNLRFKYQNKYYIDGLCNAECSFTWII